MSEAELGDKTTPKGEQGGEKTTEVEFGYRVGDVQKPSRKME